MKEESPQKNHEKYGYEVEPEVIDWIKEKI
jgi:hypothetical protein